MKGAAAVLLVVLCAVPASAQPQFLDARVTPVTLTRPLGETVTTLGRDATEPAWIAYETPVENGDASLCCWSGDGGWRGADGSCCGGCRLEPGTGSTALSAPQTGVRRLEPRETFLVFYRVENQRLERIRTFFPDCALDASHRQVYWLKDVKPAESLALLAALATREDAGDRIRKSAVTALAQHAGSPAILSLTRLARDAADRRVRGEALFWLAQRAGARAAAAITDAIQHDPETSVKEQAVFALSQLPPDEGVPRLIEVARTNANPAVRKKAMFWLGQSNDSRALAFFEQILK